MQATNSAILALIALVIAGAQARAGTVAYDPSLGTLPEVQGWIFNRDGAPQPALAVVSGILQQGSMDFSGHQYCCQSLATFEFTDGTFVNDNGGRAITLNIASGSVLLLNDGGTRVSPFVSFDTTDAFHGYHLAIGDATIAGNGSSQLMSLSVSGVDVPEPGMAPALGLGVTAIVGNRRREPK